MPCLVTGEEVATAIRSVLTGEGYKVSAPRSNGETGVDVLATRADEVWHIETIAFKSSPPARSTDFYQIFFRGISRLRDGASRIALALPVDFGRGLHQRAAQYGPAWDRLGIAFPEVQIWLVDCTPPSIKRTSWDQWR